MLNAYLDIQPEVAAALAAGKPVVALESTIISHGMPYPQNVETARQVEQVVRDNGAVPATIAILDGRLKVGLDAGALEALGRAGSARRFRRPRVRLDENNMAGSAHMSGHFDADQADMGPDIHHYVARLDRTLEKRLHAGLMTADAVCQVQDGAELFGASHGPAVRTTDGDEVVVQRHDLPLKARQHHVLQVGETALDQKKSSFQRRAVCRHCAPPPEIAASE